MDTHRLYRRLHRPAYFIETKPLSFVAPYEAFQEKVIVLGGITEASQVFSKNDYHVRACFSGFSHELQFVEAPPASFIVAGDYNLLLLNR